MSVCLSVCMYYVTGSCILSFFLSASAEAVAAAKKAQQEMYSALLAKREVLVHGLESKLTRYKELLLKEMVCVHMMMSVHTTGV